METRDGALWAVLLAVGTGAALGACGRWALSYVFNNRIALYRSEHYCATCWEVC